jgi:hypothetical protein
MKMNTTCPNCQKYKFPLWIKAFAMWPFTARCRNCAVTVILEIPRWQNVLFQIFGQIAFWGVLLSGLSAGNGNIIAAGLAGATIAVTIAIIPAIFAELEVKR